MPKKKAKKIKTAAPARQVVVKSHAYGEHTRSARGSIKPAILNDALVAKGKAVAVINELAREVHNLLKLYAGFFKESMFWQKMLSRMHAAPAVTPVALLGSLAGLELNDRYPLKRFGASFFVTVTSQNGNLAIALKEYNAPRFNSKVTAYRYDVMVLFFNVKGKATGDVLLSSDWFVTNAGADNIQFYITPPEFSNLYLICLRLHGGTGDEAINELGTQGMQIVKAALILLKER